MNIVEIIIVLLGLLLLITIYKYPKQVFVDLPIGILKIPMRRLLFLVKLFTSPIWLPIYFLDLTFNWRIFEHKFFVFFEHALHDDWDEEDEQPDTEYVAQQKKEIAFNDFSTYLISSLNNANKFKSSIANGLDSIQSKMDQISILQCKNYCVAKVNCSNLYHFLYLIQWLDNEFPKSKNYGFAKNHTFSFFAQHDPKTLNNVVGKTSENELFAYNLTNGLIGHLTMNKEIELKTEYNTNFFDKLTEN